MKILCDKLAGFFLNAQKVCKLNMNCVSVGQTTYWNTELNTENAELLAVNYHYTCYSMLILWTKLVAFKQESYP